MRGRIAEALKFGILRGFNLGHSNQRWNGFFFNVDIEGNCTINGSHCAFGSPEPPANPTTAIQFNNSGAFGGDSKFLWSNTAHALFIGSDGGFLSFASCLSSTASPLRKSAV
jgi:hypothetical protein